ncbi:MAG: GNAT family N-acetyltransferase [Frankiaceae bacterium]
MLLRPATADDLDAVLAVLDEAAGWLHDRCIDQWPGRFDRDWLAPALAAGEVQAAVERGRIVGTYALVWADPVVWGDRPDHDDAGYVHQLAVRRELAGRGVGLLLLAHAGALVADAGRRWLRLDCVAHNRGLRAYYERAGFAHCGDVTDLPRTHPAWRAASRYQRPVDA